MWANERAKARVFFTAEWRTLVDRAFPFLDRLDLAAEQRDAYAALAEVEFDLERFRAWGVDPQLTMEKYPALLQQEWAEKTRAIVGDAAFEQLGRLVSAQADVWTLANYVSRLDMPLGRQQAVQLLDILADPAARTPGGDTNWPHVYAQAEAILTGPQLAA